MSNSDNTVQDMRNECHDRIRAEIDSHKAMIRALEERLLELPHMDIPQIVSLNASLSHHGRKS